MDNQPPPASNHRSVTGFVTKLVGEGGYGFINEEIFFPQSVVISGPTSVGDQVFAECAFSAHLPIKWNATSVKILNKAGGPPNNPVSENPQQDPINQQQFNNQQPTVAVTYQQHRQQRQRQLMDVEQPNNNLNKQSLNQGGETAPRLLDQGNNQGDYFASNNQRSFQPQQPQQQQADSSIQPFQDQPMGPPTFGYTSQLGSAFQFVPPFMTQQPQMLPQQSQQQPQQQQHMLPQNNQMLNQNNQRHNQQHGKSGGGGRFGGHNENKSDRQNNRRGQNRNEDKYDGSRDRDRDGSRNRSSKTNGSRERSVGRSNKRDDIPTRPSPPPHSSARSTTSISSDRGVKGKKHYEVQNLPKISIMNNMNAYNMKQRCPSSVHVPSDLKDIIVNRYFRLDIKNMPKPLNFTIESVKKDNEESKATDNSGVAKQEVEGVVVDSTKPQSDSATAPPKIKEEKVEAKGSEQSGSHPRSDIKLTHKYGVKVILISLADLETIYRKVFGDNLDSFGSDSKSLSRLDEVISLLCNKGSNNGHSLIGGKFDPSLDKFVEGGVNEFERHKRQPDLISTCKRVVQEQTGLDLSECRSWTLLATFIYNNKSEYFSSKASVEYSFIYIPQIWTMLKDHFDKNILNKATTNQPEPINTQNNELPEAPKMEVEESEVVQSDITAPVEQGNLNDTISSSQNEVVSIENLSELKVSDLKAELDMRNVKYKAGAKKAELVALLYECLKPAEQDQDESQTTICDKEGESTTDDEKAEKVQLEEGEVEEAEDSPNAEAVSASGVSEIGGKRKECDTGDVDKDSLKKVCLDQETGRIEKVELITDSFVVRAREDQQLSLVSLYEATQVGRYDQFELSVASNILKESLVQHLSEYILTALVEDNRQKTSSSNPGTSSSLSSQETTSDTNNNNAKSSSFKNPTSTTDQKVNLKELPVDRYLNLAFTYFDSTHMGYIYFEDLNKLFNNTGLTISKRALISLVGDGEKVNYRIIPDLSPKIPPTYVYEFPGQFGRSPLTSTQSVFESTTEQPNLKSSGRMIEFKGVTYDVEKLIQQVKDAETMRVSLVDRFNYAIENSDKQAEEIHVLEVSQKSLAKAIKAQNDEICDLKRERDSIKKKLDSARKGIKTTITSLSDLIKEDK